MPVALCPIECAPLFANHARVLSPCLLQVRQHPDNAPAWRLLGTVHAENDDDRQAIAALNKALGADPTSLEVLLSLGVSHTNELDAGGCTLLALMGSIWAA